MFSGKKEYGYTDADQVKAGEIKWMIYTEFWM